MKVMKNLKAGMLKLGVDFTERSTWVGLFKLLGAVGIYTYGENVTEQLITVLIGLSGLINVLFLDSSKEPK